MLDSPRFTKWAFQLQAEHVTHQYISEVYGKANIPADILSRIETNEKANSGADEMSKTFPN